MKSIAATIIKRLGGAQLVADAIGIPRLDVYRWAYEAGAPKYGKGGYVPAEFHEPLLSYAARIGVPLSPWDFTDWRPCSSFLRNKDE